MCVNTAQTTVRKSKTSDDEDASEDESATDSSTTTQLLTVDTPTALYVNSATDVEACSTPEESRQLEAMHLSRRLTWLIPASMLAFFAVVALFALVYLAMFDPQRLFSVWGRLGL